MGDLALVVLTAVSFAALATAHVAILVALVRKKLLWRALSALFLPPLAPYWAFAEQLRTQAVVWLVAAALYAVAVAVGQHASP